ncbi:putative feruloyl esterase B-1 [Pseudocercospora fuligena]|uniref:Carboxylic ester hydrolase n=1 Tax=Pseudocercospora fuligena TaxID=685502 RepID=A0A8H6RN76_9PEZI|nr:putative feruloyl esterase B-1 [Pseudocercospora fuligena]
MRHLQILASCALAGTAAAVNCSIPTIQSFVNKLGLNYSNLEVTIAQRIDSNTTLEQFKRIVAAPHFQRNIPPVCAFRINGSTSAGSQFGFGAPLPDTWNQRMMAATPDAGMEWAAMSAGLKYGFAVIGSNSGHDVIDYDPSWANPEALIDWGYRALHESTVLGKAVVEAWYGSKPQYHYLTGCSTGARQAFKSMQVYPDDYDGIMAGAPAWWTTHQQTWNLKTTTYNAPANSSHSIPSSMFNVISDEVLRQCDPQDGLTDKVLSDPQGCNFDPTTLLCSKNQTSKCLNSPQIQTLYKMYNDWVDVNQTFVYSHLYYGSEESWSGQVGDGDEDSIAAQVWYMQNMLNLTNFVWQDLDYATVQLADRLDPGNATAHDFDISPFQKRGGKLIHWHGLSDAAVSPGASIYFHDHVKQEVIDKGIEVDDFYRLFFIPGLEHCTGTPDNQDAPWYLAGPYQAGQFNILPDNVVDNTVHDSMLSLMAWVENGTAADYMVTTNFFNNSNPTTLKHNRRICPYPQQAKYTGSGNVSHEDNWECKYLY